jgi:hypothetical protein
MSILGAETGAGGPPDRPFGPLRSLSEAQLQIQFTLASMYDTQAMGILALNGALAAAAVAADRLLGHDWWLALLGLLFSSVFCLLALGRSGESVGPDIKPLILQAAERTENEMDRGLAVFIGDNVKDNAHHLGAKRRLVWVAIALLGLTIAGATLLVLVF